MGLPHVLFDPTVAQVDHPVCIGGDVRLVGDQDDRVPGTVQPLEQRQDLQTGLRIQIPGRFVSQQNRRIVDEGARDRDALTLTAGQLVRLVRDPVGELDPLERLERARAPDGAGDTGVDERQLHVVQRRGSRQQVEGLEDEPDLLVADARQLVVLHLPHLLTVEQVTASAGRVQAPDQVHQGGLPGAGRPHDRHILTTLDLYGDPLQGMDLLATHAVGLPQVACLDQGHVERSPRSQKAE